MTQPAHKPPGTDDLAAARALFRRAEAVFADIQALPPAQRDAALTRSCAGDRALESLVRGLVGSAAKAPTFLEQPALGRLDDLTRAAEPPDELLGATIGPFRILRRIASGGMGTVYLAARSDGQFEQTVALKVVKRGMDSEEILRRFRAERQALAALTHPGIARLIDGGITPDGRPYLVMEYVEGKPIDAYCDEHRLTIRDRLRLFRQVCEAVHHAHANLVIHRDLKPGNILITPQGAPKLLDFGIAKVLSGSATRATADTDRRLTPEYASPEQIAGGPMTTATDVYSLGVVLYQLLTGAQPYSFHLRTTEELRRVVLSVIPPPPSAAVTVRASRKRATTAAPQSAFDPQPSTRGVSSTRLRGQLRGDLDTIVLMALRKEPHRRYPSVEALAADINRYLEGLPVQARRDTLAYRASKFIRRHPVSITAAITVVVTLAAATVLLSNQAQRLQRQRDELITSNKRLDEARRYLQLVLGGAETGNHGPDARLADVLKDAAATLATAPPSDPLTRAAAQQSIGRAMLSLGLLPEARALLESASQGFDTLPEDADARLDIRVDLAELLFFEGKYQEAEAEFRALLAEERRRNPGTHTEREGTILTDLGACLRLQGKFDDAINVQRDAVAARTAVLGANSLPVAESRNNLASALFQKGDTTGAIQEFEASLSIRQALLRPNHPLVIRLKSNLGLAKLRTGALDEAVTLLISAADAWDTAFGPDHPGRVSTLTSLSMALRKQHKHADALAALRRALDWQRAHQPEGSPPLAATEANIGITLVEMGDDAAAEPILTRVLPILKSGGPASVTKSAQEALATIYERTGRADLARPLRDPPQ